MTINLYNNIFYTLTDTTSNLKWDQGVTAVMESNAINKQDSIITNENNNISGNFHMQSPSSSMGVLQDLGNPDWSLKGNSLCINNGNSTFENHIFSTDLFGNSRIVNSFIDIGAIEYQKGSESGSGDLFFFYPNPTHDNITLVSHTGTKCELKVFDVSGKLMFESHFSNFVQISLLPWAKNIYIFEIKDDFGTLHHEKIIKF